MTTTPGAKLQLTNLVPNSINPNHRPTITSLPNFPFSSKSKNSIISSKELVRRISYAMAVSGEKSDRYGMTYKEAGVDIDAGAELVRRIAKMAPGIGGFGGLFPYGDSYLVAGTDGVGTKLKLAFESGIHDTIGIDLVAMSVNDIVTSGAKPLFFLDYYATSRLDVNLAEKVIKGIVDGCQQSECALLGGETAEMPDFYAEGEYDLSGFAVGIVEKDSVIDGKNITVGDVIIGLPSSGVHSNGFSLVRRVLAQSGLSLTDQLPGGNVTLGEALMAPTVIYVKQVLDIINKGGVKGIAHITGGGFTDNIPRVFPKGLGAAIDNNSWVVPPVFKWIQEAGRIEEVEMMRTFNMGIGMVLIVTPDAVDKIIGDAPGAYSAFRIGEVVSGDGVTYRSSAKQQLSNLVPNSINSTHKTTITSLPNSNFSQQKSPPSSKEVLRRDGYSMTYKEAGVDIDAGAELVQRIAKMAPGIGGFGGLFPHGDSYLVAGTDGVGTKLKLAFETGIHDTIGIDLVAMSVNDIVTSGAKPLFFLDYFATSRLDVDLAEKVVKGIVHGCQQSDCILLGGETAEMPDFYAEGEYDLSGFAVGTVKKESVIDGKNITVGDVIIGLPSSGVHSNGFSLVRRVLAQSGLYLNDLLPGENVTLGKALMAPTVIYVKQVLDIISKGGVKGIAHITGGGFTDNIPRVFPKGLGAAIYNNSWVVPPVFKWIQEAGRIEEAEMMRTFNMGIGMVLVVSPDVAHRILGDVPMAYTAYRIGEVVTGDGVTYR